MTEPSVATQIQETLRASDVPLSIDEICLAIWKRVGTRERGLVRVNLHRLDAQGVLVKLPMKYRLKAETRT